MVCDELNELKLLYSSYYFPKYHGNELLFMNCLLNLIKLLMHKLLKEKSADLTHVKKPVEVKKTDELEFCTLTVRL